MRKLGERFSKEVATCVDGEITWHAHVRSMHWCGLAIYRGVLSQRHAVNRRKLARAVLEQVALDVLAGAYQRWFLFTGERVGACVHLSWYQ